MKIRHATEQDAYALSALLTELGYADTETFITRQLQRLMAHPDEQLLIAEEGNTVLGFLSLHFIPQLALPGDFARISYFCVAEGERSKGLGQTLLAEAEQRARAQGCDRMEVHCNATREKANQFYVREDYIEAPVYRVKMINGSGSTQMKVALGQFAVSRDWQENRATCSALMQQAAAEHADLLVLPEAVLATDLNDPLWALQSAQSLDGPFVTALLAVSAEQTLTTLFCMHVPAEEGKAYNTLVAIAGGKIVAHYKKLHLYDAFTMRESNTIMAGETLPALLSVAGMNVGLMTCYDIRFPEMARWLALQGADVLVLPSAWVKGPLKEHHWETLVTARALENTCYMVATGECGMRNIGQSMVVDPLGTIIARAAEAPALIYAELTAERLAHAREVLPVLKNRRFAAPVLSSQ